MSNHGWPAVVMTLLVLAAASYSFSPRPLPPYPETTVRADRLLLNSIAQRGDRIVAVGELGHILIADNPRGPWREATVTPQRGSTLTRVIFIDDTHAIAVGQDGWILRSDDRGERWTEVNFEDDITEPLLAISGPHDGLLHAVGGFGLYRVSDDLGQTWTARPVTTAKDESEAVTTDRSNPFAMMDEGIGDRHLNALVALNDGRLLMAGESGVLARSDDGGNTWKELESVYPGSFFGALSLPDAVLVFGMRGNVFRSTDGGDSWQKSRIPEEISLFGGAVDGEGRVVLVGGSNTLIVSDDGGQTFTSADHEGLRVLADVLPIDGGWLTAGEGGLQVQSATPADGEGS